MNLFGTDGIRGIANSDLTCKIAFELGRAAGSCLSPGEKIAVGKDTRISGDMLEASLVAGITSTGRDVVHLGIVTTPGLSFIVSHFNLGGGVMISASHNSFEYNGLKVFGPDGKKIPDQLELQFSEMILVQTAGGVSPTANGIGRAIDGSRLVGQYVEFLSGLPKADLSRLRILVDTANGSASCLAPRVWKAVCPAVDFLNSSPDGLNINAGCGSTHPSHLAREVARGKYDAGFAYDGDGDRCIAVDEHGNVLTGDHIMAIMALDMVKKGRLSKNTVVGTVMANFGLERCLSSHGITLLRTPVGDRFVLEEMDRDGYSLGGEQSGHIIFSDILKGGDGMLTSLLLAEVLAMSDSRLSTLASVVEEIPQVLVNVRVPAPRQVVKLPRVQEAIEKAAETLSGVGRVLVRPSGTEPVVRIMVESEDGSLVKDCIDYLEAVIKRESTGSLQP